MNAEGDSTNVPTNTPPTRSFLTFEIEQLGKKDRRWRLGIRPSDLVFFEGNDPNPYVILREQFKNSKDAVFAEPMRALSIQKPKKVIFKLSKEATAAVAEWMGKPLLAGLYLSYAWVLPVAVFWLLGSIPMAGNPQSGVQDRPVDILGVGLGLAVVVSWAFAKWRPHSLLFLVDSIWILCLAGYLINNVVHGRSKLWLILVPLLLWLVVSGVKLFLRFRGTPLRPVELTP